MLLKYLSFSAVQATVTTKDWEGGTPSVDPFDLSSTPLKRPAKRRRVDLEEELDDPFEGPSSPLAAPLDHDSTYDPENYTAATLDSTIES